MLCLVTCLFCACVILAVYAHLLRLDLLGAKWNVEDLDHRVASLRFENDRLREQLKAAQEKNPKGWTKFSTAHISARSQLPAVGGIQKGSGLDVVKTKTLTRR
jgi:outer membrane murein-binding lipoprotein Lpp